MLKNRFGEAFGSKVNTYGTTFDPKSCPKDAKKAPKRPQWRPKGDPRRPKASPRPPKGDPRRPKEPPRRPQGTQKAPKKPPKRRPKNGPKIDPQKKHPKFQDLCGKWLILGVKTLKTLRFSTGDPWKTKGPNQLKHMRKHCFFYEKP